MKCVQLKGGELKRVLDTSAARLVSTGAASYVAKKQWKQKVRDAGAKTLASPTVSAKKEKEYGKSKHTAGR